MEGTEIRWDESEHRLYALLAERVDATSRQELEEKLAKAMEGREIASIRIDAGKLDYISSAGIRILLGLRRNCKDMKIINVSQMIYDVLDSTGIPDMLPVERSTREVNEPAASLLIRKEPDGDVYRWEEDQALKVFHADVSLEEVKRTMQLMNTAASFGVPTPTAYEVVSCGGKNAMICEYPSGQTLAEIWETRPDGMQEECRMLAELMDTLHHHVAGMKGLPDAGEIVLSEIRENSTLSEDQKKKLTELSTAEPGAAGFVYGNLRLGNVVLEEDRLVLLDMSRCGRGNAVLDLQIASSAMCADGHEAFWKDFFGEYAKRMDPEERAAAERTIDPSIRPWWKG